MERRFTSYYDTAITAGDLELAPGESVTFSVQPEEGLEAGSYNSPLSIGGKIDPSSRQFIYAQVNLTYSVEPGGGDSGSSGGGSGNGGHTIWLPRPEHGRVTVSPSSAAKGSVVTLTVTADTGFALKTLTVTDGQGNQLKLDDKGNGKYTFTMPGSQVEISASFQEIAAQPESLPFADVAETAWYYDGVAYVYEKGLMTGTSAAAFSPNLTTSRSMVAAILWRLAGSPAADDPVDFADVAQGQWYTDAIRWAASEGIVGGYGDGTFGADDGSTLSPQGQATRAEAAVLLMRWQEALS